MCVCARDSQTLTGVGVSFSVVTPIVRWTLFTPQRSKTERAIKIVAECFLDEKRRAICSTYYISYHYLLFCFDDNNWSDLSESINFRNTRNARDNTVDISRRTVETSVQRGTYALSGEAKSELSSRRWWWIEFWIILRFCVFKNKEFLCLAKNVSMINVRIKFGCDLLRHN